VPTSATHRKAAAPTPEMCAKPAVTATATTSMTATAASTAMTATAASSASVCFECEQRNDEEQHDGNAGASRKHQFHRTAELGARCLHRRMKLYITPRTKGF